MKKSRFTEAQIMGVLRQAEGGFAMPELWPEHGINIPAFYGRRAKFGDRDAPMMSRIKELKDDNRRLKLMFSGDFSQAAAAKAEAQKPLRPTVIACENSLLRLAIHTSVGGVREVVTASEQPGHVDYLRHSGMMLQARRKPWQDDHAGTTARHLRRKWRWRRSRGRKP